jgi:hypothetical protein
MNKKKRTREEEEIEEGKGRDASDILGRHGTAAAAACLMEGNFLCKLSFYPSAAAAAEILAN